MDLKGSGAANNARVAKYLGNAGASVPAKFADGGAVSGKRSNVTLQINIGKGAAGQPDPMAMAAMAAAQKPPVVNPPPAPPMPPPGMGAGPGGPPMPGMGGPPGMKSGGAVKLARGGSAFSAANKRTDTAPKDGDQKYGTSLMGKMAKGGAAKMDFGSLSGPGREEKLINQARASGQKQPVKGTAMKAQKRKA